MKKLIDAGLVALVLIAAVGVFLMYGIYDLADSESARLNAENARLDALIEAKKVELADMGCGDE